MSALARIRRLFSHKKYENALRLCKQVSTTHPGGKEILKISRECQTRIANYWRSLDSIERSLAVNSSDLDLLQKAYYLSREFGDSQRSLEYAEKMISSQPKVSAWYLLAAQELVALGEFEKAELVIRTGINQCVKQEKLLRIEKRLQAKNKLVRFLDVHRIEWNQKRFYHDILQPVCNYFCIENNSMPPAKVDPGIDAIVVVRFGRFSNLLIQLGNALQFAEKVGIRDLYIDDDESVRTLFPKGQRITLVLGATSSIMVHIGVRPFNSNIILSTFYFTRHRNPEIYSGMPPLSQAIQNIKASTPFSLPRSSSGYLKIHKSKNLCIHLRSGDIFKNNCVGVRGYGQPPLSYYIMCIDHYCPKTVTLVYEDMANPVIGALERYLNSRGLPFNSSSGASIADDIFSMLSSDSMAIGIGSFAKGIIAMSNRLKVCYTFCEDEAQPIHRISHFIGKEAAFYNIYDAKNLYHELVIKSWRNSSKQRNMMLTYPVKNLAMQCCSRGYSDTINSPAKP